MDLSSVIVENGFKSFSSYAFFGCRGINSFQFPDTLSEICSHAMSMVGYDTNGELGNLKIPYSVKTIGESAFCEAGLREVVVLSPNVSPKGAFANMPYVTYLYFGDRTGDFSWTFQGCKKLEWVVLLASTGVLGTNSTFASLLSLIKVHIYASKSQISGMYPWRINEEIFAPNATITWM